jgi:diaminopimelate epimerase
MRFSKWHALGNSYLLVERVELGRPLDAAAVGLLCDPGRGVGADGVVEVLAADGAEADVAIWNPDGSQAEFSGNGTRLAAMWLARRSGVDEVTLRVGERSYRAVRRDELLVEMEVGRVEVARVEELDVSGERVQLTPVSVGNPHAVVRLRPTREDLLRLGPRLERHERFPGRTNVQLAEPLGPHAVRALVWERGAGETSSSGSSAVAVAAAAVAGGWGASPLTVQMPGGELLVRLDGDEAVLTGPAETICEGELLLGELVHGS